MEITRRAPGPPSHPLVDHLPELRRDQLGFMHRWAREYGDVVLLRFGPLPAFLLSHPDLLEHVLVRRHHDFIRPRVLRQSRITFGDSLFVTSGAAHMRQRRLVQPAFHRQRIEAYAEDMIRDTERQLSTWRDGDHRDLHEEMMRLTLIIVGRALFGVDVEGAARSVGDDLTLAIRLFTGRMRAAIPLPDTVPTPANLRNRRVVRRLNRTVDDLIDRAQVDGQGTSILDMLAATRDEDGEPMPREQLRRRRSPSSSPDTRRRPSP